jgi:hypothetical protein
LTGDLVETHLKEFVMRMRYRILACVAAGCLTLNGCNQVAPTPPPDATTDTPTLDIEQGIEVAPDEIGKKTDAPAPDAGAGDAKADAGTSTGGQ